jgi:hypothetical protein
MKTSLSYTRRNLTNDSPAGLFLPSFHLSTIANKAEPTTSGYLQTATAQSVNSQPQQTQTYPHRLTMCRLMSTYWTCKENGCTRVVIFAYEGRPLLYTSQHLRTGRPDIDGNKGPETCGSRRVMICRAKRCTAEIMVGGIGMTRFLSSAGMKCHLTMRRSGGRRIQLVLRSS